MTRPDDTKPVYASTTMQGLALTAAATLAPVVLTQLGISDPGQQQAAVAAAFQLGGILLAAYGRLKAHKRIG